MQYNYALLRLIHSLIMVTVKLRSCRYRTETIGNQKTDLVEAAIIKTKQRTLHVDLQATDDWIESHQKQ